MSGHKTQFDSFVLKSLGGEYYWNKTLQIVSYFPKGKRRSTRERALLGPHNNKCAAIRTACRMEMDRALHEESS